MKNTRQPAHDYPEREDAMISAAPVQPGAEPRWASLFARMLLPTMLFAMSMMGIVPSSAKAAPNANANAKATIAADLRAAIASPRTPAVNWARELQGQRYAQVIVVSNSTDPELADLRKFVVQHGRLGARAPPGHQGAHGGDEDGHDQRHGAAQGRGQHLAEPRGPPRRQHAGNDHRRVGRQRPHRQHQDRLQRPGRHAASASPCWIRAS